MAEDHITSSSQWTEAAAELTRFVTVEASAVANLIRFGWEGDPSAPSDYGSLLRAYARSRYTRKPLPVSDQHVGTTIYCTTEANLAYRFWHDVTHVLLGRGFDLDGEIAVAKAQLGVLRAKGLGEGTLAYELFRSDTLEQTIYGEVTGTFPKDQTCFVRTSLDLDLARAIRAERMARVGQDVPA